MLKSTVIVVPTAKAVDVVDITPLIASAVAESGVYHGLVHVILQHTSAAVAVQEHEPNLVHDFESFLRDFAADDLEEPRFRHNQLWRRPDVTNHEPKNASAHIKALFMGNSRVVPIVCGKLCLGDWQRILLVEMDGPRSREVQVMTQGDTVHDGIAAYWAEKSAVINAAIEPFLKQEFTGDALNASRYITQGGKRIRGTLTLLVCEALGGDADRALDAAVAIELVHAASLIKDDLHDGDTQRRNSFSAWFAYGARRATTMADVVVPHALTITRKYGTEAVYACIDAWKQVGVGQLKDLFVGSFRSGKVYDEIVRGKTAALFGLACALGAIAAKADEQKKHLAVSYGQQLGYLFQVVDDLADVEAGKSPPEGFVAWAAERPREKVAALVLEVRHTAEFFPPSDYRNLLMAMPQFAYDAMLKEAAANKITANKAAVSATTLPMKKGRKADGRHRASRKRPRKAAAL